LHDWPSTKAGNQTSEELEDRVWKYQHNVLSPASNPLPLNIEEAMKYEAPGGYQE
jgi:hypothetical protein